MIIYLDFESTGLNRWHDQVTQVGAVAVRCNPNNLKEWKIVSQFETLVLASKKISEKASEITGITNEMLEGYPNDLEKKCEPAPKTKKALSDFFVWIRSCRKNDREEVILSAYNGFNFDFPMLFSEMFRCEMNIVREFTTSGIKYCKDPLIWARANLDKTCLLRNKTGQPSFKLGDVHSSLIGNEFENAHSALADTRAMFKVCCHEKFCSMLDSCKDLQSICIEKMSNQTKDTRKTNFVFTSTYLIHDFLKKRQSINAETKKNVTNKIQNLFQLTSRKRKTCDSDNDKSNQENVNFEAKPKKICVK
jgi:DNA polymerase III alpha subunit (gram-positive type)